jgi:hypothetical protein
VVQRRNTSSIVWCAREKVLIATARRVLVINVLRCVCVACLVGGGVAQRGPSDPIELWGKELLPPLSRTASEIAPVAGVTFLDSRQLVVYAVDKDLRQLSSRESPEQSSPFRLHVWIVDADSGKTNVHKEWGTRSSGSEVKATSNGILVKTGAIVRLYSADLSDARDLPVSLETNGTYYTSVSVSGNSIALVHYARKAEHFISHVDVIDANSLKIFYSSDQYPPTFHISMSDRTFLTVIGGALKRVEFRHPDQARIVPRPPSKNCPAGGSGTIVISDDLVAFRDCEAVIALNAKGDSYILSPFNGYGTGTPSQTSSCAPFFEEFSRKSSVASEGRFVAFVLPSLRIKRPLFGEQRTCLDAVRIGVFDLARKKQTSTIDVGIHVDAFDFALSPDGSRLAVLKGREVSVYSMVDGR